MPAHKPDAAWNTWQQPAAVDWTHTKDSWGYQPAESWGASPWDAQVQDSWSDIDAVTPWNSTSTFIDRWAAHAVGEFIPFWRGGVIAAEAGEQPAKLGDFLDQMERSAAGKRIWQGLSDVRDEWATKPLRGDAASRSSDQTWGSRLHSRPRTASVKGWERERSRRQKTARLEQKGIYWPEADSQEAPDIRNFVAANKSKLEVPDNSFIIEDGREWVEDIIAETCEDSRSAKRLRAFWEASNMLS